jgi:hypothetical protein
MSIKQGGWSYTLTPADKLWAARMVQGEGPVGDSAAVLWTMTQLFAPAGQRAKYGRPDRFRSFAELIKAYSQPINPRWLRTGDFCRPGGSRSSSPACSETRLRRREVLATMPYVGVDAAKRSVVERWASGALSNPVPGAYEFAHRSVLSQSRIDRLGLIASSRMGNLFLGSRAGLPSTSIGGGMGGTVLLIAAGGTVAWFGARWLRRRRLR